MILIPEERHIRPLTTLWQTVFGDAPDYIALFFDGVWQRSRTFAAAQDGKIVSALYLLDCRIQINDARFDGYYLYAAATLPAFRGKGLMGALVREAQDCAAQEDKDFIALVPANDGLYDYYARFGFVAAMQRYLGSPSFSAGAAPRRIAAQAYYEAAKDLPVDRFLWTPENHAYALACLAYDGFLPHANNGGVLLTDADDAAEALAATPRELQTLLCACGVKSAAVPFALPGFTPQRFGMVWAPHDPLKTTLQAKSIYMNLALD